MKNEGKKNIVDESFEYMQQMFKDEFVAKVEYETLKPLIEVEVKGFRVIKNVPKGKLLEIGISAYKMMFFSFKREGDRVIMLRGIVNDNVVERVINKLLDSKKTFNQSNQSYESS